MLTWGFPAPWLRILLHDRTWKSTFQAPWEAQATLISGNGW